MSEERKNEPPFGLNMDFGEALERFVRVVPKEAKLGQKKNKKVKRLAKLTPEVTKTDPRTID